MRLQKVMSQSQELPVRHHEGRQVQLRAATASTFTLSKPLSPCVWTDLADTDGHLSTVWKGGRSTQQIAVPISCENILNFWNHYPIPASILSRNLMKKMKSWVFIIPQFCMLHLVKPLNDFFFFKSQHSSLSNSLSMYNVK